MIYLDVAATTKPKQEVVDAMMPYLTGDKWYNPSSLYSPSVQVKRDIEEARKTVADFIGADADEIYFTSGGSEGNCWVVRGWDDANFDNESVIITTPIEHKSMMDAVDNPALRSDVYYCQVNSDGIVNISSLENLLKKNKGKKILVSIMLANNEIGSINDIKFISDLVHSYNGVVHTDATQAFGQTPIIVDYLGIDMMTASGHKIGAPKGIGFLYKRSDVDIAPLIYGSQNNGKRGGTENVPYIIGLAKAVELAKRNVRERGSTALMRDYLIYKLKKIGCTINGSELHRLPNNISVVLPYGINAESMLYCLELCGLYVSTGSACNSHAVTPSYVLQSLNKRKEALSTIRITIDSNITFKEVDKVICEMEKQIKLLKE